MTDIVERPERILVRRGAYSYEVMPGKFMPPDEDIEYVRADRITALEAELAEARLDNVSEPTEPGAFVGDIFFGHPTKTTMGTHKWDGTAWVALPSEIEALLELLVGARRRAETAEARAYELAVAIMGGEDAPGYANSIPTDQLVELQRKNRLMDQATAEAALRSQRAEVLREVRDAIADYPRTSPDGLEAQHYDEQIEHCQAIIDAMIDAPKEHG